MVNTFTSELEDCGFILPREQKWRAHGVKKKDLGTKRNKKILKIYKLKRRIY